MKCQPPSHRALGIQRFQPLEDVNRTIRLRPRPWHKAAFEKFQASVGASEAGDVLAVAAPGAGNTTFALTAVRHWLAGHLDARAVVVAPTQHLKLQWAANRL